MDEVRRLPGRLDVATMDRDGRVSRLVRNTVDCGDGVAFVSDRSVGPVGDLGSSDETATAALLAVEAAKALPTVSSELLQARRLLERAAGATSGDLEDDIAEFLGAATYADAFDVRSTAF